MLKLVFIFIIGIAYAAQTRVKIGSKSWGYRIELNQGRNVRTEFSNDDGVTHGSYIYKLANQTKMLEYRIDPNRQEPDISFKVKTIDDDDDSHLGADFNSQMNEDNKQDNATRVNQTMSSAQHNNATRLGMANETRNLFDTIDSNEEFRGQVTFKVGNATYNINFVTGDKSNNREETLTSMGVLYGRLNYVVKNSATKVVINYKFNSSSADPTFEVSLFKSSETEVLSPSNLPYSSSPYNRVAYYRPNYNVDRGNDNRMDRRMERPSASSSYVPPSSASDRFTAPSSSVNGERRPANDEKYRNTNTVVNANWYHNRVKMYDP